MKNLDQPNMSSSSTGGKINWEQYNYPPRLKLVHYDICELPETLRGPVRWSNRSMKLLAFNLFFNFVAMIIVASGGTPNAGFFIAFSLFNGILLSGLGFYGFYAGYKYIATGSGRNYSKYLLIQVILFVLGVVFSASGGLNMNGFGNYDRAIAANNGISDFWAATAIIEGILWTL
eukprot:TRINITY_DN805_c0_g1_i12.p1 TRINITY_DN805_c0_g1~~TRINITY_DN805_c0_g1_i12.p1  ORF type:complete len:175 (+),score=43.64 TRINITY_DN805_c0_g1_i12:1-525(+)